MSIDEYISVLIDSCQYAGLHIGKIRNTPHNVGKTPQLALAEQLKKRLEPEPGKPSQEPVKRSG